VSAGVPSRPAADGTDAQPAGSRRRRRALVVLGGLLALGAAEQLALPPPRQPTARLLLAVIDGYQALLSPRLAAAGVRCRFTPTCSRYAEGAIRRHGSVVGVARAARRLARCGPWTPSGTVDPP
jgi:putative membrane protein insertion efficiency factor